MIKILPLIAVKFIFFATLISIDPVHAAAGVIAYQLSTDEVISTKMRARAGDSNAAFTLYQHYSFVVLDTPKGKYWLRRAAKLNHVTAQYNLGVSYATSEHPNFKDARHWLQKAAQNGSEEARATLEKIPSSSEKVKKSKSSN